MRQNEWSEILRALREASGITQAGWAARLGYGRRTVQRWEHGDLAPDAAAAEALIRVCSDQGLWRRYGSGPLGGVLVSEGWLRSVLAEARARGGGVGANQCTQPDGEAPNASLRTPLTSFVGRERERSELRRLLRTHRLLTLTGAGGIGKTRLALELATEVEQDFADGVMFVDLSGLTSAESVAPAIARSLGLRLSSGRSVVDIVAAGIAYKWLLLVLDNFEHVPTAALDVAQLLRVCPNLKVIATSRAPLHITGEQEVPVPPLDVPRSRCPSAEDALQYDAVQLFVERAHAVEPDWMLTEDRARVVAQICARLDGLPLAIELTAPLIRLLPLPALLQRLDHRLKLLVGGAGDRPARHQTLRATIDWSYNLLDEELRMMFRRLGVFAGSWDLQAAATICELDDSIEALRALLDQSLIRQAPAHEHEARFGMLESVREYALEQLQAHGEVGEAQRAHAEYFLQLSETANPGMVAGPERAAWLRRLDAETDNLLTAMRWCFEQKQVERGLRLGAAASRYWFYQGSLNHWREWRRMLAGLAELESEAALRARALNAAGLLAYGEGDLASADALHLEALAVGRELEDAHLIASSLHHLGRVAARKRAHNDALEYLTQSLAMWRDLGDRSHETVDITLLGGVLFMQADFSAAYARWMESAALCREIGDKTGTSEALSWQGFTALELGDPELAASLCEEALRLAREDRNRRAIGWTLLTVGLVRLKLRDYAGARSACLDSVALRDDTDEAQTRIAVALEILAGIACDTGQVVRALRLFGAAEAVPAAYRTRFAMFEYAMRRWEAAATRMLGGPAASALRADGRRLTAAQALNYAMADEIEVEVEVQA